MNLPRWLILVSAVALVALSALVLTLAGRLRTAVRDNAELRREAALPHRGLVVPTFRANTVAGDHAVIGTDADSNARQLLLVFTSSCPVCRATLPLWVQLADSLKRLGGRVAVYGISLDSPDSSRAFVEANRIPFPVVMLPERKLIPLYHISAVPQSIVVSSKGVVTFAKTGRLNKAALDSLYSAVTAGRL